MKVIATAIKDVVIIEPQVFGDDRGYFFESYSQQQFDQAVRPVHFVQDNESKSRRGVLRGLHFQKGAAAQSKLVRVVQGRVLDVAVDIRRGSPTFGKHVAVELTAENHRQLFVPRGFAHGFSVLSDEAVFQYKCDNFYAPQSEGAIVWNDPDLGIDWQLPAERRSSRPKTGHIPASKMPTNFSTMESTTMHNILVTGADGQLGREMRTLGAASRHRYFFTDVADLDITDANTVRRFVENERIDAIVNCAAYTNVDKAEEEAETADRINHEAVRNLAEAAKACGATLFHISTDYLSLIHI